MTFQELLSDIKSTFRSYDAAGLIDELSVYNWYLSCLREFGALPLETFEEVLEVRNGQAKLPDGFRKLILALKCEPFVYKTKHKDHLQDTRFWKVRHEKSALWSSCEDCCIEEREDFIVEKFFYREYESEYYYKNPILLRLVPGINRKMCTTDCKNFSIKNSPYEINILKGKTLQANFDTGNIFIRYKGFEEDEDGFIEIPETYNGYLEEYITNEIKSNILEDVIANGDAVTNEATLLGYYAQKARDNKVKAMTELKAKNFSKEALRKYKNKLKTETRKFECMF